MLWKFCLLNSMHSYVYMVALELLAHQKNISLPHTHSLVSRSYRRILILLIAPLNSSIWMPFFFIKNRTPCVQHALRCVAVLMMCIGTHWVLQRGDTISVRHLPALTKAVKVLPLQCLADLEIFKPDFCPIFHYWSGGAKKYRNIRPSYGYSRPS